MLKSSSDKIPVATFQIKLKGINIATPCLSKKIVLRFSYIAVDFYDCKK